MRRTVELAQAEEQRAANAITIEEQEGLIEEGGEQRALYVENGRTVMERVKAEEQGAGCTNDWVA
jgi:hypothetical protein